MYYIYIIYHRLVKNMHEIEEITVPWHARDNIINAAENNV